MLATTKLTLLVTLALLFTSTRARADAYPDGPTAPPPTPPPTTEEKRDSPADDGDAEHLRLGALVGVGFPRPLSIEGMVKLERVLGLGLEYGVLPTTTIAGVATSSSAVTADLRVFPFRGAFFVGLRAGHQRLSAETTLAVASFSVTEAVSVDTWFVNPRVGFLWTWDPGITLGIEAGVQIPLSSSTSSTLPPGLPGGAQVASLTSTLGTSVLPTVDLLRVGLLF